MAIRLKRARKKKIPGSGRSVPTRAHTRDARGPKPGKRVRVKGYRRKPPRG